MKNLPKNGIQERNGAMVFRGADLFALVILVLVALSILTGLNRPAPIAGRSSASARS